MAPCQLTFLYKMSIRKKLTKIYCFKDKDQREKLRKLKVVKRPPNAALRNETRSEFENQVGRRLGQQAVQGRGASRREKKLRPAIPVRLLRGIILLTNEPRRENDKNNRIA